MPCTPQQAMPAHVTLMDLLQRYEIRGLTPISILIAYAIVAKGEDIDITKYQSRTGSLIQPSLVTRPDFYYTASYLGRFNSCPKASHSSIQKRIIRYIKGSLNIGILYNAISKEGLIRYLDTNYRGDLQDRKSTSGIVFTLFGGVISQASTKQKIVVTTTIEADYIALTPVIKEALQLK